MSNVYENKFLCSRLKTGVYMNPFDSELLLLTDYTFETAEVCKHFSSIRDLSDYLRAIKEMLYSFDYIGDF